MWPMRTKFFSPYGAGAFVHETGTRRSRRRCGERYQEMLVAWNGMTPAVRTYNQAWLTVRKAQGAHLLGWTCGAIRGKLPVALLVSGISGRELQRVLRRNRIG